MRSSRILVFLGVLVVSLLSIFIVASEENITDNSTDTNITDNTTYTCQALWTGYEYNNETQDCEEVTITGCSNPFNYSSKDACEKAFPDNDNDENETEVDDDNDENETEIEFENETRSFKEKIKIRIRGNETIIKIDSKQKFEEGGMIIVKIRARLSEGSNETLEELILRLLNETRLELESNGRKAYTDLELEEENETIKVKLNNGRYSLVKIMPDTASDRALERLRLKVCNETNNCTIELKEVGKDKGESKIVYEVKANKDYKVFWLIKTKGDVSTQIDSETGEEIVTRRPWWRFVASQSN